MQAERHTQKGVTSYMLMLIIFYEGILELMLTTMYIY